MKINSVSLYSLIYIWIIVHVFIYILIWSLITLFNGSTPSTVIPFFLLIYFYPIFLTVLSMKRLMLKTISRLDVLYRFLLTYFN